MGGSSSVIVIPVVQKLGLSEKLRLILSLDSVLTDVFCIVVVVSLCTLGSLSPAHILRNIFLIFLSAAALGIIVGVLWLWLLPGMSGKPFTYMTMLAVAVILYTVAEWLGVSGAIAVLAFGITLGNALGLTKMLGMIETKLRPEMKRFHDEVTFLIRVFFLVYIGSLMNRNVLRLLPVSLAILAVAVAARLLAAKITCLRSEDMKAGERLIGLMLPKGLAAAVLSFLPARYGLAGSEGFPQIAVCVILLTNLLVIPAAKFGMKERQTRDRTLRLPGRKMVRQAGFEPAPRAWQARVLTKLDYCRPKIIFAGLSE